MIFDGHTDIWTDVTNKRLAGETDIFRKYHWPKWQKGKINGGIFVIWIDPPYDKDPKKRVRQIIASMQAELLEASDILTQVLKKEDFLTDAKRINMVLGMEGLSHVDEETGLEAIDEYYRLGVRHASLTWNEQNALATGVRADENRGLTPLGKKAVQKMNDLGMLVDVSHLNERSFWDLEGATNRPFMASHSNAKALCGHKRNLSDEQIKAIGKAGGIIGLNAYNEFVDEKREAQTPEKLARHGAYIADLIGVEHLVFGFDFCDFLEDDALGSFSGEDIQKEDYSCALIGMKDSSEVPNLLPALKKVGFRDEEIHMICYQNYKRFIQKIWK